MSDSVLKKQFQQRDVERLRNLVKGKHGSRTTTGIGYNGEIQSEHKEGDIWQQSGRTWTIKNGIKENITKLDNFKKASIPLFCPKCKTIMDAQLDPYYFKAYGECIGCRAKTETQLKISGEWINHINETFNAEIDTQIEEYKGYFESTLSQGNEGYISENGEIQQWSGGIDKEKAQKTLDEVIFYFNSLKK